MLSAAGIVVVAGSLTANDGDCIGGDMGAGGGAMVSGSLREEAEDTRRGLYGEGGKEFRSGAMFAGGNAVWAYLCWG